MARKLFENGKLTQYGEMIAKYGFYEEEKKELDNQNEMNYSVYTVDDLINKFNNKGDKNGK